MMRQMRENTKWIMLVTALAFVALMVFEWGMDATGRSAGGLGQIGSVNGDPIMYEEWQAAYRNLSDRVQEQQADPLTSQQVDDLEDSAFDELVNRVLVQQELERRGVRVTDDEIRQAARFNPPPGIREAFQGEQGVDLQQYQEYLASPAADPRILTYIEEYYRDVIPRGKLLRQISSGVYLTDQELWRRWLEQNETVEIRFVALNPMTRIADEDVSISDDEIRDYYEENQEEFELPSVAEVKAVVIGKAPTPADTAAVREQARTLLEELGADGDWQEIARAESGDAATAESAGELGVLRPQQLVPPMDSAVFQGPVGEIQGPIRTRFGLHLVEVQERWARDSVRARHVLLPFDRTDDSEIAMLTMADSLEALAEERTLTEAASIVDLPVVDAELTEDFSFVPGAGQVGEGLDWAFEEAIPGDVSPVFENQQAFYALELVGTRPERIMSLEEAESSIRQTLLRRKKIERSVEEGREIVGSLDQGTSLGQVATDHGLQIQEAGPFTRTDFVPGLGRQNAAIGAAFGLDEPGDHTDVVETASNVYVLELMQRTEPDRSAWEAQKATQRLQEVAQIEQARLQEWLDALRANARIVDRRAEVRQPQDEERPVGPVGGLGL